jgi:hypothetical protein
LTMPGVRLAAILTKELMTTEAPNRRMLMHHLRRER